MLSPFTIPLNVYITVEGASHEKVLHTALVLLLYHSTFYMKFYLSQVGNINYIVRQEDLSISAVNRQATLS
jgi:hypothetical protein